MRVAVVGHVEWIEFAVCARAPRRGDRARRRELAGARGRWGGGGGAAPQARRRRHALHRFRGRRGGPPLRAWAEELGLDVEGGVPARVAAARLRARRRCRRADDHGARAEARPGAGATRSGGSELDDADAVYFTAGDAEAVRHARRAGRWSRPRVALATLVAAGVELDVLVASAKDAGERYDAGSSTRRRASWCGPLGAAGGEWEAADGSSGRWEATPLPGPWWTPTVAATASRRASPTAWARAMPIDEARHAGGALRRGVLDRSRALRGSAARLAAPSGAGDSGRPPGSIGRPALDPGEQAAVEVVGVEAGGAEGLRRQRRAAPRAAVEEDRPSRSIEVASAASRSISMWRAPAMRPGLVLVGRAHVDELGVAVAQQLGGAAGIDRSLRHYHLGSWRSRTGARLADAVPVRLARMEMERSRKDRVHHRRRTWARRRDRPPGRGARAQTSRSWASSPRSSSAWPPSAARTQLGSSAT